MLPLVSRSTDTIEVPVGPVTPGKRQHRRGVLEGLAIAMVVLALASAYGLVGFPGLAAHSSPGPSGREAAIATALPSSTAAPLPLPTPSPAATSSPTLGPLPGIAMERLPGLVALSKLGAFTYGQIGDRLVTVTLFGNGQSDPGDALAFDLFSGQRYVLKRPGSGAIWGGLSLGLVTASIFSPAAGTPHAGMDGLVIEDLSTGALRAVWPRTGYDAFRIAGLADGYAYGAMVRNTPTPWPSGAKTDIRASRAVVVKLATGDLIDLTPGDAGDPANASVEGVDGGQALVVAWGAIDGPSSPVMRLVNLASGVSSDILPIDPGRLPGFISTLRMVGGLIVGQTLENTSGTDYVRTFVYDIGGGSLGVVPVLDPGDNIQCPNRVDATHLACEEVPVAPTPNNHLVLVYDTASQITSSVPSPGLEAPYLLAAANGCVVVGDFAGQAPLAYAPASGLLYGLELGEAMTAPTNMDVVGNLVVSSGSDGSAWRLP